MARDENRDPMRADEEKSKRKRDGGMRINMILLEMIRRCRKAEKVEL